MKTINYLQRRVSILMLSGAALFLWGCDDSEGKLDVDYSAPAQVSQIASTSGPGEVYLTWTIPTSPNFMYSKVTYINSKGEETYKLFSKDRADENGVMHETISGFASTDPVDFNIYACSVKGASLEAVKYTATPGAPAFLIVAQSVDAEPAYGGINVSFNNETAASVVISVKYALKDDDSKSGEVKFTAPGNTSSSSFVALTTGEFEFINGETAVLSISAQDAEGNAADPISKEVRTKKVEPIDRSDWTFPGYQDTNDATIGYSSQEAGGEGASPNGRVIAMIDGNTNSFWHTAWKTSSAYPHFFIVDMGEEHEVTNVSIRRRTNNNGTHTGQSFFTCDSSDATGSDPDKWNWTSQGWASFNRDTDYTQVFGMQYPESTRYIKVYFAESDKGGNFVMISEFNAYAPAE